MNATTTGRYKFLCLSFILASVFHAGCEEKDAELGAPPTASFKVTPIAGKANKYLLESTSQNAFRYQWDKGAGQGLQAGQATDTAYFLKKGTYDVKLYAYGNGGYDMATEKITVDQDDLSPILNNPVFKLLTAHPWKLDASSSAPIIVGTEANPAQYFGGGALANCQTDDVYTFAFVNNDFKVSYNANGSTFNAGNIAPNYACGADRSYSNVSFLFSPTATGAGITSFTLPGTPPTNFIGVTDIASNNFRIISISATEMVLRAGKPNETVFQFRFVAQ